MTASSHPVLPQQASCGKYILLTLGGTRSGKSDYAEQAALALAGGQHPLYYIATGQAVDAEMKARINQHQRRRSSRFNTIEAPLDLAQAISTHDSDDVLLIDSLGAWVGNQMMQNADLPCAINTALTAISQAPCSMVLVSDEIGMGIIPDNAMSRAFRDHIGTINQGVAAIANTVVFMVAGLPMIVKSESSTTE
jgi:adenosylcobinamide kinase/adenosylcobinamide-phosphate guanylyltransferase